MEISNEQWRCPVCETVNQGNACDICGFEKSTALKMEKKEDRNTIKFNVDKEKVKADQAAILKSSKIDNEQLFRESQRLRKGLASMWIAFTCFIVIGLLMFLSGIVMGGMVSVFFVVLGSIIQIRRRKKIEKMMQRLRQLDAEAALTSIK